MLRLLKRTNSGDKATENGGSSSGAGRKAYASGPLELPSARTLREQRDHEPPQPIDIPNTRGRAVSDPEKNHSFEYPTAPIHEPRSPGLQSPNMRAVSCQRAPSPMDLLGGEMESGSVGSGPPSASPSPPSPAHAFVGRNKHEIRIEKLPDNAAAAAKVVGVAKVREVLNPPPCCAGQAGLEP